MRLAPASGLVRIRSATIRRVFVSYIGMLTSESILRQLLLSMSPSGSCQWVLSNTSFSMHVFSIIYYLWCTIARARAHTHTHTHMIIYLYISWLSSEELRISWKCRDQTMFSASVLNLSHVLSSSRSSVCLYIFFLLFLYVFPLKDARPVRYFYLSCFLLTALSTYFHLLVLSCHIIFPVLFCYKASANGGDFWSSDL